MIVLAGVLVLLGLLYVGDQLKLLRYRLDGEIEAALRQFPHFADGQVITAKSVQDLAEEYEDMVMNWAPIETEIQFRHDDGRVSKIVYEIGEVDEPGAWRLVDEEEL